MFLPGYALSRDSRSHEHFGNGSKVVRQMRGHRVTGVQIGFAWLLVTWEQPLHTDFCVRSGSDVLSFSSSITSSRTSEDGNLVRRKKGTSDEVDHNEKTRVITYERTTSAAWDDRTASVALFDRFWEWSSGWAYMATKIEFVHYGINVWKGNRRGDYRGSVRFYAHRLGGRAHFLPASVLESWIALQIHLRCFGHVRWNVTLSNC